MHRVLVIAPHADDEVLGCGGLIAKRKAQGCTVDLVVVALGGVHHRHLQEPATVDERMAELCAAAATLGIDSIKVLYEGYDMRLDTLPRVELVTALDGVLDAHRCAELYFPHPSINHDHQVVYEATCAALRPGARAWEPSLIAQYEYGHFHWNPPPPLRGGRMYVDITRYMEVKERAFAAYASQIKNGGPASFKALRALAKLRGLEAGCEFAEMFWLLKLSEG